MKRVLAVVVASTGLAVLASSQVGCSSSLSQPFEQMKTQPVIVHRLQNYEPPAAAATPGATGTTIPGLPPQIQQWLSGAAAALPPGLIPPGLLPGTQAPATADGNFPRFYNFRILGTTSIADAKLHDEILDLFGKEANFEAPRQSCMYAEFGFQIGQGTGQLQGVPPTGGAPADILVSLSCDQVQMNNYAWPYGTKTGLTDDAQKKIVSIVQRAFGG